MLSDNIFRKPFVIIELCRFFKVTRCRDNVVSACQRSLETNCIQFIEYSFCCRELKWFYNFFWSHDNGITNTFQTCLRYTWAIFSRSLVIVAHWDGKLWESLTFFYIAGIEKLILVVASVCPIGNFLNQKYQFCLKLKFLKRMQRRKQAIVNLKIAQLKQLNKILLVGDNDDT